MTSPSRGFSRRDMLKAAGLVGLGSTVLPSLSACGVGGGERHPNGASEITGSFDWKKLSGQTVRILQTPHPYQQSFQPLLKEFTELTGIQVVADLVPEGSYFTKLNTELAGGSGSHDVFMVGAYFIWQYGPPGWMEDLKPWIANSAATSDEYDFEDIYEGLRTSTSWDFTPGSPLGTGGQWAIPWGFENNVVAYNKAYFDAKGIKPAEDWGNFQQLARDLTDRNEGRYGVAFRGSKSWATIHPGFITQYSRMGCKDYEVKDGRLVAGMASEQAIEFQKAWVDLAREAGPASWTTYEYPDCTRDLGNGNAMMCYDADSATYPKNKPGASKEAGNLAWYAGPAGPDGSYATNLWTWSLAMNAASKNKLAAWLFIQWATGKEAMSKAVGTAFADPTRKSVFDSTFKQTLGAFPGYLDAFEKVVGSSKIQFTPQTQFFQTTQDWSVALQDIYGGDDAASRLRDYAASAEAKVNV
ncbi:extracellular solute-binding protein [Agilicoccus flavus]|uniref:extracellular solute-binding protein n=1 Tax=Agilicoccus flavus TaxID=2775968 RepID=UPI001CF6E954|nr:extracellular solute-binding protein [Agilicoccus flavus]